MPCGKCWGQSANRASAWACGFGRDACGVKGGQDAGQDKEGSEGSFQGSDGKDNAAGHAASSVLICAKETTEGSASKGVGSLTQEGAQLLNWVDSAPAVTSPRAVRRSVVARRPADRRRGLRDLDFLVLALGMGRGC